MRAGRSGILAAIIVFAVLCGTQKCHAVPGWANRHFDNSFQRVITAVFGNSAFRTDHSEKPLRYRLFHPDPAAADTASKIIGRNVESRLTFQKNALKRDLFLIDYKSVNYLYTFFFTGQSLSEQYEMLKMLLEIKRAGP